MNLLLFWELIKKSRGEALGPQDHADKLLELLKGFEEQEIVVFDSFMQKRFIESNRQDLLALTRIINDSCSEMAFRDFRGWLIAQGREFYQTVLNSPSRVIERVSKGEYAGCEEILDVAAIAYESKKGENLPFIDFI